MCVFCGRSRTSCVSFRRFNFFELSPTPGGGLINDGTGGGGDPVGQKKKPDEK